MKIIDDTIKKSLRDLAASIDANKQALDNAVSEIEYLERQNDQLRYQIEHAFTFPDGSYINLEELGEAYWDLVKRLENLDV